MNEPRILSPDDQARLDAFLPPAGAEPAPELSTVGALDMALRALALNREALAAKQRIMKKLQDEFVANNTTLAGQIAALKKETEMGEADARALALRAYADTKTVKPTAGVEIKLFSVLDYDPAAALRWAKEHQVALVPEALDVKTFETIAKAAPIAGLTTIRTEPKATVATDLTKALAKAAGAAIPATGPTDETRYRVVEADEEAEALAALPDVQATGPTDETGHRKVTWADRREAMGGAYGGDGPDD